MGKRGWRVLIVGVGSPNADMVAEVLNSFGIQAEWTDKIKTPSTSFIRRFDVVYGIYLQTCSRYIVLGKMLHKVTMIHFVGSDAYRISREDSVLRRAYWSMILRLTDQVIYVSPHLEELVRRPGFVLPFPIATADFKSPNLQRVKSDRDTLYYCPSGSRNVAIYRLSWILEYARDHPDEKITILGNITHPADYEIPLPNVEVVPFVNRSEMPVFYRRHRKLIRMTTEDGLPRMIHEALLCGLEVVFNGQKVKEIPPERDPATFASSFRHLVESLLNRSSQRGN